MTRTSPAARKSTARSLWLHHPALDLIVGCGAWSAPLIGLAYFTGSLTRLWPVIFYGLALFFNYPHYMATIYRAFHRADDFSKYRLFTLHITGVLLATTVLAHFYSNALPWIFTLYLTWSPWHYSGQNYGVMMMFARRAGADPDRETRQALHLSFVFSYAVLLVTLHAGASSDWLFLSAGIPERVSLAARLVLAIAWLFLSVTGFRRLAQQTGWRPLAPAVCLLSTQFLWFVLPSLLSAAWGLRVPQSRYSTGVLAVMHAAQYLWITSYYARREAQATSQTAWRPTAYFAVLVAGGIALFLPGPWLASRVFHFDFTTSFLIFTALVNLHHFILDGAIWKLRDGRIAALLLNSKQTALAATGSVGGGLANGLRWFAADAPAPRRLRWAALGSLLLLGGIDQTRYFLAAQSENLGALRRAAVINPFDSSLQMRLARRAGVEQQPAVAVAAWQKAAALSPHDPAPRAGLLQQWVGAGNFEQAYALAVQLLKSSPNDANLLINHGILAAKLGHGAEAIASWQKALASDPQLNEAHLYLANQLEAQGQPEAAVARYTIFLDRMAKRRDAPSATILGALLRLAHCQERLHRNDDALRSYGLARELAARSGELRIQSVAAVFEADLLAQNNRAREALPLYQNALRLDAATHDARIEGADWYNYGLFLRDHKFPVELAYAALLRSRQLLGETQDAPEIKTLSADLRSVEKRLPPHTATIRYNLQPVLEEALSFKR